MDQVIRKIQLVAVAFILIATSIGFLIEVHKMIINQNVDLADLLLLFIYIEVIGMIRLFWESKSIRISYPLLIAITALSRLIILSHKKLVLTSPAPSMRLAMKNLPASNLIALAHF